MRLFDSRSTRTGSLLVLALAMGLSTPIFGDGLTLGAGDTSTAAPVTTSDEPAATGATAGGWKLPDFAGMATSFRDSVRASMAGNPVTLTDRQRGALQGMRPALVELAGPDAMFNRGDTSDVVTSLRPAIAGQVRSEISRQAQRNIQSAPFPRVRRRLVGRHMDRHYTGYFNGGMAKGNGMVRSGLEEFYQGVGVEGAGQSSGSTARQLDLQQMERFRQGAETLREIDRIRAARVQVAFQNGFGVADLDSILADPNKLPPNGTVRMRPATPPVVQRAATGYSGGGQSSGGRRRGGFFRRGR